VIAHGPNGPWPTLELETTDKFQIRREVRVGTAEVLVAQLHVAI
jgi:hypothetical protein